MLMIIYKNHILCTETTNLARLQEAVAMPLPWLFDTWIACVVFEVFVQILISNMLSYLLWFQLKFELKFEIRNWVENENIANPGELIHFGYCHFYWHFGFLLLISRRFYNVWLHYPVASQIRDSVSFQLVFFCAAIPAQIKHQIDCLYNENESATTMTIDDAIVHQCSARIRTTHKQILVNKAYSSPFHHNITKRFRLFLLELLNHLMCVRAKPLFS